MDKEMEHYQKKAANDMNYNGEDKKQESVADAIATPEPFEYDDEIKFGDSENETKKLVTSKTTNITTGEDEPIHHRSTVKVDNAILEVHSDHNSRDDLKRKQETMTKTSDQNPKKFKKIEGTSQVKNINSIVDQSNSKRETVIQFGRKPMDSSIAVAKARHNAMDNTEDDWSSSNHNEIRGARRRVTNAFTFDNIEDIDPNDTPFVVASENSIDEFMRIVPIPLAINVAFSTEFKTRNIRDFFGENEQIIVNITEIINPFRFWFHLDIDELNFIQMTAYLSELYSGCEKDGLFQIHPDNIKLGQVCAVKRFSQWKRAEIVQLQASLPDIVTVFLVDFGTVHTVPCQSLRLLTTVFDFLPKQIMRGCLDHVVPLYSKWTMSAVNYLLGVTGATAKRAIYGKATYIDDEKQIAFLKLARARSDKVDINLNVALTGYNAAYTKSAKDFKVSNQSHCNESYPCFEKFENGEHPTVLEMAGMREQGFLVELRDELRIKKQIIKLTKRGR